MDIKYRKAEKKDAQAILDYLDKIGTETDNLTFGEEGLGYTLEDEESAIEKINESDNQVMIIAFDQSKVVSVANLSASSRPRMKHFATIGISVLKEYWHKGIGTEMMKQLMDYANQSDTLEILRLDVRSDNKHAIHLYENFGFEKYGTFKEEMKINGQYISTDNMRVILKKG